MSEAGRGSRPEKTHGLHLLGCCNRMPQPRWLAWCRSQGGPRSGCRQVPSRKSLLPVFPLSSRGGTEPALVSPPPRTLIPSRLATLTTSATPVTSQRSPNAITVRVRMSAWAFGGHARSVRGTQRASAHAWLCSFCVSASVRGQCWLSGTSRQSFFSIERSQEGPWGPPAHPGGGPALWGTQGGCARPARPLALLPSYLGFY